jgi:hypothetical protein
MSSESPEGHSINMSERINARRGYNYAIVNTPEERDALATAICYETIVELLSHNVDPVTSCRLTYNLDDAEAEQLVIQAYGHVSKEITLAQAIVAVQQNVASSEKHRQM